MSSGINDRWLSQTQQRFGISVEPFGHDPRGLEPAPWGWSKASRRDFLTLGFDAAVLPSDDRLDAIRRLSHRRTATEVTAAVIARGIAVAPPASELKSPEELERFLAANQCELIFKAPYSSSGRGLVPYSPAEYSRKLPQLIGIIRQQGSVMVERRHCRRSDFALLFSMEQGTARFCGLSLFATARTGAYEGNVLIPQCEIASLIQAEMPAVDLRALIRAAAEALEECIGAAYSGPLGIDMITLADGSGAVALCEINLRNTMGRLCLSLTERFGFRGHFRIVPAGSEPLKVRLNPPGSFFDIGIF